MLREGIEAALVVGIIASFLRHSGRAALMPAVWVGVLLAVAVSLFAGAGLQWMAAEFPQKQQELFEAVVGLVAVGMLTAMVFWMRKAARSIKGELQASVTKALAQTGGPAWALIGMVFLAVAREGLESVFFLLAIFQHSDGGSAAFGALLGIALAVVLGWGIYKGGVRLNLRQFFRYTGVFILLVAAGLLAGAVRRLHEAGVWNHWQQQVLDTSAALPQDSPLGVVLGGLFGYMHTVVLGEALAWGLFLAVTLVCFFWPSATGTGSGSATSSATHSGVAVPAGRAQAAENTKNAAPNDAAALPTTVLASGRWHAAVAGCVVLVMAGVLALWQATAMRDRTPPADATADLALGTVTVEVTLDTCTPNTITVPAGRTVFRIVNHSKRALEWEILDGVMVLEERENILPGMTQQLTARLAPGTYSMTCGLLSSPRGSLVVTPSAASQAEAAKPSLVQMLGPLADYQAYVMTEEANLQDMLVGLHQRLVQPADAAELAAQDGLPADAMELLGMARGQYQRLAPVATQYSDLNVRIDARANDFAQRDKDPAFVGLQRVALGLQAGEPPAQLLPLVAQLQADTQTLGQRMQALQLEPKVLAGASARALERASTLLPGDAPTPEQGRWVLQFVQGTVHAAAKAQALVGPLLANSNPALAQQLQQSIDKLQQLLAEQGVNPPDGVVPAVALNPVQIQNLAQALYQASQAMAKVNPALGLQP